MPAGLSLCTAEHDVACRRHDCKTVIASLPASIMPHSWEMIHGSGSSTLSGSRLREYSLSKPSVPTFSVFWNHMKQRTKLGRSPHSQIYLLPSFLISYGRTTPSFLEWQNWSLFLRFILWFSLSCYQSLKRNTTTKQNENARSWSSFPKVVHRRERNRESAQEHAAVVGERMGYKKVHLRLV